VEFVDFLIIVLKLTMNYRLFTQCIL